VGGFCEQGGDGALHNSAVLVERGAVRVMYRKAHLWDREPLVFSPGDAAPPVVETAVGRIGVMVCYDLEFIFVAACDRTGRERGVDWVGGSVIVDPDGWPLSGPLSPGDAEPILAVCRLQKAGDKALGPRNDVHGDRRPELYDSVRAAGRV
jgi:predicted amidohydrolase